MRKTILFALFICFGLSGCNLGSSNTPTPTPTVMVIPTYTPSPTLTGPTNTPTATPVTATPTPTFTPVGGVSSDSPFCGDAQVSALLASFKTAILTSNGPLFSSLVSPLHGMEARYWRNGRVVNYDQYHAKFLFETTFKVNWGAAPGSGRATIGSFHEVIIPPLRSVFNAPSTINVCNQIKTGGATYTPGWPYYGVNFYSIHYPGTQQNGNLDWRTWLVGVEYVQGKPYLYALIHLNWEP